MENINVTEYLKNEYREYAYYVIESRAIPSVIDGLKPIHRKIVFTSNKHIKGTKNKVATLAGKVISDAQYHHGNVSCEGAIVNMAQTFKNNLSIFERIGQFGSLKSPHASASRYISVKLSTNYALVYKDTELLEYKWEEGQKIEPYYYLPIIPMVLVNGGSGIAVGYASTILNRDSKDIIKKCISYLNGKRLTKLKPHIEDFSGSYLSDVEKDNKWHIKGKFENVNTTVNITELPPSMSYEKMEDHLEELLTGWDKVKKKPTKLGKVITNWENEGKDGKVSYVVKFTRDMMSKFNTDDKKDKLFKLTDQVSENFTTLDENGKLKIFDSAEEILKYFVDFRLSYYQKRKDYQIGKIDKEIEILNNKTLFIKSILDGKIVINKKKKVQIIVQIEKIKIVKVDDSYDYLLNMPIYSLTKEKIDEMNLSIKTKKTEQKEIKKSIPKETYINELQELLGKL